MTLVLGALLGFISVAFGAFAEHALKPDISDEHFRFLMTAIRYNQIHALIISIIGIELLRDSKLANLPLFKWSGLLFILGTVLFSFSIYLAVSFAIPALLSLTPIGGITIMVGWLALAVSGLLRIKDR